MESYDKVYKGKHTLIDNDTGEVIEVDKIYRRQIQGNFVKAYIKGLVMMLDIVGGSKLKIVNYLLDNLRLSDNKLLATQREIAEEVAQFYEVSLDYLMKNEVPVNYKLRKMERKNILFSTLSIFRFLFKKKV